MILLLASLLAQDGVSERLRKAVPDAASRLRGDDAAWAAVFLEGARAELGHDDLDPLARRALKGARSRDEASAICLTIGKLRLTSALPELVTLVAKPSDQRPGDASGVLHDLVVRLGEDEVRTWMPDLLRYLALPGEAQLPVVRLLAADGNADALALIREIAEDEEANEYLRLEAFGALVRAKSPDAPRFFASLLTHRHDFIRAGAARALGRTGAADVAGKLLDLLKDEMWTVRAAACDALGRLGAKEAVEALADRLLDEVDDVQAEAARALGRIGTPGPRPLRIVRLLKTEDCFFDAADVIGDLRLPQAVPDLLPFVRKGEPHAARALGRINSPAALKGILELARSEDELTRRGAATAMAWLDSAEPLRDFLGARDPAIRLAAWEALARAGARLDPAPLLNTKDMGVREAGLLAWFGAKGIPLEGDDLTIRLRVPAYLGETERGERILEILRASLKESPWLADAAIRALASLGHKGVIPDLEKIEAGTGLVSTLGDLRYDAAMALCRLGNRKGATRPLRKAAEHLAREVDDFTNVMPLQGDLVGVACLNALRRPELYARLSRKLVCWRPFLEAEEFWTAVEKETGMRVDAGRHGGWMSPWTEHTLSWKLPEGVSSVREAMDYALMLSPFEYVLENDHIRILDRREALRFWTSALK